MDHRERQLGNQFQDGGAYPKVRLGTMWYVIQTITGKEVETVGVIDKVVAKNSYTKCFVIQRECVWRIEGKCRVHIEPLFPSYVFVETDTPDIFFYDLKQVPKLTKLLGRDGTFWTVLPEEQVLLKKLIGNDPEYVVRRSLIEVNEQGNIISAQGVLGEYIGMIVRKRLRKRVVIIELLFLGEVRRVQLGVRLAGDED